MTELFSILDSEIVASLIAFGVLEGFFTPSCRCASVSGLSDSVIDREKDYLKGYQRIGNHFITTGAPGGEILAPACLPVGWKPGSPTGKGVPGGMLSLSVDPNTPGGGVLFGSCPQDAETDLLPLHGKLYAFDPMNLERVWDNTDSPRSC